MEPSRTGALSTKRKELGGTCLQAVPSRNIQISVMSENNTTPRKKLKRYDIAGHAHEMTFSCYHRFDYLNDRTSCLLFLEELGRAKQLFKFKLWAYVLMPNHVHLLLFPYEATYKISAILQSIKGRTSKRYGEYLQSTARHKYQRYCIGKPVAALTEISGMQKQFIIQ